MLRSKLISDYQAASLDDFRAGVPLPVDVHLYFSSNHHILIWRKSGECLSETFIEKYRKRGMQQIWIHRDDQDAWQLYCAAREPAAAAPIQAQPPPLETEAASDPAKNSARTAEGLEISEILDGQAMPIRQRTALIARAARELLAETAMPQDPAARLAAMEHAREVVRDILDTVLERSTREIRNLINEIWNMSTLDPGLDHGINVATLAILFALAFGRISAELLADIALAALLHDVGLTQIPAQIVHLPSNRQNPTDKRQYARHVDEGLRLLDELTPMLSSRVRPLIQQHHEKFDGTGYPLQLQGSQIGDISQLVAMADAIESVSSGQWDGQTRSMIATLGILEKSEKNHPTPELFNPEVFTAVARWIRFPGSLSKQLKASEIVRATARELMGRKA